MNVLNDPQDRTPAKKPDATSRRYVLAIDLGSGGHKVALVAEELGLHPSTPVMAGIVDSNASSIGSGAVNDFEAIIYIGTSLYMNCQVPFKKTAINHMMGSLPSPFRSKYRWRVHSRQPFGAALCLPLLCWGIVLLQKSQNLLKSNTFSHRTNPNGRCMPKCTPNTAACLKEIRKYFSAQMHLNGVGAVPL